VQRSGGSDGHGKTWKGSGTFSGYFQQKHLIPKVFGKVMLYMFLKERRSKYMPAFALILAAQV